MSGNTSRKPSGSSSHARSPAGSPGHNPHRKLHTGVYGVGVTQSGLKPLNAGWQVWGSSTPSRNPSASSTASRSPSRGDTSFRAPLSDSWTSSSRPPSGSWDEAGENVPLEARSLQPPRHRQGTTTPTAAFSGPRVDEHPKERQFSPQRYENSFAKETNGPRFSSASPTPGYDPVGFALPTSIPTVPLTGNHEVLQMNNVLSEDLALALRGMAVEDDRSMFMPHPMPPAHQHGPPPVINQPQAPYANYPLPDYNGYYPPLPPREPYIEFPYAYGPPDPSLYSSPVMPHASPANIYPGVPPQGLVGMPSIPLQGHPSMTQPSLPPNVDMRQQSGFMYEYGPGPHPPPPFYFSGPQPMMFPAPTHSPIITTASRPNMTDKKLQAQHAMQQQQMPRSRTYPPVRSSPSPNRQVYGSGVEYTPHSPATQGPGTRSNRRDANAPPIQIRSAILDEFRGDKTRKWELNDIKGFIVEFSCDQHGSRFIQQKLESASSEERQAIFDEIAPNYTLRLMQDVFGNYVIQKVFEFGTQAQKDVLATAMEGHVLQLTLQVYGCRVVQKAVEHVLPEQQSVFVREIEPHVLRCVKDSNGNHVIQKMVQCVPAERLGFIKSFRGSVRELATHPYGCRVLQRCLEHITEDLIRPIREELHSIANKLMVDQFGNYVVQFLLEHGKPQDKALVVVKLRGQLLYLARHKFASNVCERALLSADIDSRRMLIDEIMMNRPGDGFNLITALMRDQYGNYVLQRALTVSEGEQREVLFAKVRAEVAQMRRFASSHSKHLISIERLLEKHSQMGRSL